MEPLPSPSSGVPTAAAPTYASKAPGRKGRTRRSNPRPCKPCKQSHLACNALPPFSNGTCERCTLKRLRCEQPVVEVRRSNSDARQNPYPARSSRAVTKRRSPEPSSEEERRLIAQSSAQVIPSRQNITMPHEQPPTPPTRPIPDAPLEGPLTPQAMTALIYFSPPNTYQSLMGGGLTDSFVANYDIPLGSLEIPIGPLLDQYGYTTWNNTVTNTDGDDYTGIE